MLQASSGGSSRVALPLPCVRVAHPSVPPLLLRSAWLKWGYQEGRFAGFPP